MIEERILEIADRLEQQAPVDKRQAFVRLQAEDPDIAGFLRQVADVFGKPAAISIRFRNGEQYIGGRFYDAQDCADFEQRLEASRRCFGPRQDDDDNE